jgi:hypothetical protein
MTDKNFFDTKRGKDAIKSIMGGATVVVSNTLGVNPGDRVKFGVSKELREQFADEIAESGNAMNRAVIASYRQEISDFKERLLSGRVTAARKIEKLRAENKRLSLRAFRLATSLKDVSMLADKAHGSAWPEAVVVNSDATVEEFRKWLENV